MSVMRAMISRCAALFRRRVLDRELDDEVRAHLEMAAEANQKRGMSAEAARLAALREFGGVTQAAGTFLVIAALAWPGMMIEIDATASTAK